MVKMNKMSHKKCKKNVSSLELITCVLAKLLKTTLKKVYFPIKVIHANSLFSI